MASLPISLLPALGAPLENNAEFAVAQDGVTYRVSLANLSASVGGGGGAAPVVVDGVTIQGNGVSVPLSAINPLPAVGSNGQVLTVVGGNIVWATPPAPLALTVQTNSTLTGNGTPVNPLSVANPLPAVGSNGQVLTVVGGVATWAAAPSGGADDWGAQVVETDGSLAGDGTSGNPLIVANPLPAVGSNGQVLTVVGGVAAWAAAPSGGADDWGAQVVETDSSLTGDGTSGNPLAVANPIPDIITGMPDGWVLTILGGNPEWSPISSNLVVTDSTLTGVGTVTMPLSVANPLPTGTDEFTIRHNGGSWVQTGALRINGSGLVGVGAAPTSTQRLLVESNNIVAALAKNTVTSSGADDRYGIKVEVSGDNTLKRNVAGWFVASNTASVGNKHALRLQDGTEAAGKVLACLNADGDAAWAPAGGILMPTGAIYQTMWHNGTSWQANNVLHIDGAGNARFGSGSIIPTIKLAVYCDEVAVPIAFNAACKTPNNADVNQVGYGISGVSNIGRAGINVAGYFASGNATTPGNHYALRLDDGRQAANRVFKCVDASGHGIWDTAASAITGGTAPTISGSKGGNAALGNLLTALAALGLIIDSTT